MTVSVGASFLIALVAIVALALFIGIVMFASRRPSFKHPKPPQSPTGVIGGIHEGDPRSVAPRRDEPVEPAEWPQRSGHPDPAERAEPPAQRRAG